MQTLNNSGEGITNETSAGLLSGMLDVSLQYGFAPTIDDITGRAHRRREIDEAPDFVPPRLEGSPRYVKLDAELNSYFSLLLTSTVA
jgi:hypothetical protein